MTDIATNEPAELRAGLTWQWSRQFSDYPASAWTLKYWFKKTGATGANFSLTATASGDWHVISDAASSTALRTAGEYTWAAVVTAGAEAFQVDTGRMKVLPRYDVASNLDDRSHARKMVELLEAALEAFAANPVMKSYTIGTRSFERKEIDEIKSLRDQYKADVAREDLEEAARNGKGGGMLVVRL